MPTYIPSECAVFRLPQHEFGALSNAHPDFPIRVPGTEIVTKFSELLFQAMKYTGAPDVQQEILEAPHARHGQIIFKKHHKYCRSDWLSVRVLVMHWVLRLKLAQHYDRISEVLESTGDKPIVSVNPYDDFWGATSEGDDLYGENMLGRLWRRIRADMRKSPDEFREVPLLGIPDAMICNCFVGEDEMGRAERLAMIARTGRPILTQPQRAALTQAKNQQGYLRVDGVNGDGVRVDVLYRLYALQYITYAGKKVWKMTPDGYKILAAQTEKRKFT